MSGARECKLSLPPRRVGVVRQRLDVSGKIFDAFDLMLREKNGAEFGMIQPTISRVFDAAKIQVKCARRKRRFSSTRPKKARAAP